jgi:hypothetical protein
LRTGSVTLHPIIKKLLQEITEVIADGHPPSRFALRRGNTNNVWDAVERIPTMNYTKVLADGHHCGRAGLNPFHNLTLGLQPIVQFMTRFGAALKINFMGARCNFIEAGDGPKGAVRRPVL